MNEQIKKLLDQATMDALYETQDAVDLLDNSVARQQRELQLAKFAELIVRESVAVADNYVKNCTCEEHINCKHPRSAIGRKIREHFGVKT